MESVGWTLIVLAVIAFAGVVAILHHLAILVRNETAVHDFRLKIAGLKVEKARRLREIAEAAAEEILEVDESPAARDAS